jgi:hypothetical protein
MRLGSLRLTATVLLVLGALRACAWIVDPTPHIQSLLPLLAVPVMWGYVELVARSDTPAGREILGVYRTIFTVVGLFFAARACLASRSISACCP